MSQISQCENNIRRYRVLKSDINSILKKLSISIDSTRDLNNEIKNKYLVNDNFTPIVVRNDKLKNNIESTYNYLSGTILPAIDLAISNLYKQISKLKREERENIEKNR